MKLDTKTEGKELTVKVDGDIDVNSVRELKAVLEQELVNEPNILLDCENLNYIDSTGLGVLVSTLKKVQKYGGSIKITKLKSYLGKIFNVTGLTKVFEIEVVD